MSGRGAFVLFPIVCAIGACAEDPVTKTESVLAPSLLLETCTRLSLDHRGAQETWIGPYEFYRTDCTEETAWDLLESTSPSGEKDPARLTPAMFERLVRDVLNEKPSSSRISRGSLAVSLETHGRARTLLITDPASTCRVFERAMSVLRSEKPAMNAFGQWVHEFARVHGTMSLPECAWLLKR